MPGKTIQELQQEDGFAPIESMQLRPNTTPFSSPATPGSVDVPTPNLRDFGSVFNQLANFGMGMVGTPGGWGPRLLGGAINGMSNEGSPFNAANAGNVASAVLNSPFASKFKISAPKSAAIESMVPGVVSATNQAAQGNLDEAVSQLLIGGGLGTVNATAAKYGEKQRKGINRSGVLDAAKTVNAVTDEIQSSKYLDSPDTSFANAYNAYHEDLPKARESYNTAVKLAGSSPTRTTAIPENVEFNKTLRTTIGKKEYTLEELTAKYNDLEERFRTGKLTGGAKMAVEKQLPELKKALTSLEKQARKETITEPDPNYRKMQDAKVEIQRVEKLAREAEQLKLGKTGIMERLDKIRQGYIDNNDSANLDALRRNPLGVLAARDLEDVLSGTWQKNNVQKREALNRLELLTRNRPETQQMLQNEFVSTALKDINLADVITGKASPDKLKTAVNKLNIDNETLNIIFKNDPQAGRRLVETLKMLPNALSAATARVRPSDFGGMTMGASGARIGFLAGIADPNAWVNLMTSKKFLKQSQEVIDSLAFLSDPAKIKKFEKLEAYPKVATALLRNIELRLKQASDESDAQQKAAQQEPAAKTNIPAGQNKF